MPSHDGAYALDSIRVGLFRIADVCIDRRMPRLQVYLPDDLYAQLKEHGLPASELLQEAVRAELRRRALYVVGRQPGPDATTIILDVAKNDPDRGIRGEAMRWLSRVGGDAAIPQLEELLRTSTDEHTQRAAASPSMEPSAATAKEPALRRSSATWRRADSSLTTL